jgi:hypothetical protein
VDLFNDAANSWDNLQMNLDMLVNATPPYVTYEWAVGLGRVSSPVYIDAHNVYPLGQRVDSSESFHSTASLCSYVGADRDGTFMGWSTMAGTWSNQTGYVALQIQHDSQTYYGWAEVSETFPNGPAGHSQYPIVAILSWGCQTTPDTPILAGQTYAPLLSGDANLDAKVSFADYLAMEAHFGNTGGMNWADGDFNNDGAVTFADYLLLEQHFGQAVPEPCTLLLLAGAAAVVRRR